MSVIRHTVSLLILPILLLAGAQSATAAAVDLSAPGYRGETRVATLAHLVPIDNQELYGFFGARFAPWDKAKRELGMLFMIRFEVWPPNEGNWLVNARMLDARTPQIELITSELTNRGNVEIALPLVDAQTTLAPETLELLYQAWLDVLAETRFPPPGTIPEHWRDGTNYRFAAFVRGYGWMEGQTFSPSEGAAAALVALGLQLRSLLEAEPGARATLEGDIRARARALLEQVHDTPTTEKKP